MQRTPPSPWDDYLVMAQHLRPAGEALVGQLGPAAADPLVDLGTGTGTVLVEARRRGWFSIGIDLDAAQLRRVPLSAPAVIQADMGSLPLAPRTVGAVASNFGLIFASDPDWILAEAFESLVPGGVIAFTSWTPDGWPQPFRSLLAAHAGTSVAKFPTGLGFVDKALASLRRAGFVNPAARPMSLWWEFCDLDDAAETLTTAAGGLRVLRRWCEENGSWPRARRALIRDLESRVTHTGAGVNLREEYLLVTATVPDG